MSEENAGGARHTTSGRPRILSGILAAMLVVTVITACGNSGGKDTPRTTATGARAPAAEVASLLAGIPQHGSLLGNRRARVELQYFGDLQCPFCRRFTLGALPGLIRRYVRTGKLSIEYRSLETATRDPETFQAQQVAALAAGKQDKLWNYIELFYHEQSTEDSGYVNENYLQRLAEQVPGLNLIAWTAARNDPALTDRVIGDARAARETDINSTPSFRIGKAPHTPYAASIEKALKQ
jgi:protein-disulfide isomerase